MPKTADQLRAEAADWRETAALADADGKTDLARTCRAEANACDKQADTQTR